MEKEKRRKNDYYVDGNTVRRAEAAPDYRQRRLERINEEEEAKERRRRRMVRREQERTLRVGRSYLTFLTMVMIVFGVFAGTYIKIQSDVTSRMDTVSNLESQIADLKAENDEAYKRLSTSVDLESVKKTALVKDKNISQAGVPESFRVLIKEFQALGLDISFIDNDDQIRDMNELEEDDDDTPITIDEIDVNKEIITNVTSDVDDKENVPDEENEEIETTDEVFEENPTDEELEAISEGKIEGDEI